MIKSEVVNFIYNNYEFILLYLIIGGILCNQFCKPIGKKQQQNIDKVNTKNLYLNRIDIIDNKVSYIIILIVIGIIYLFQTIGKV